MTSEAAVEAACRSAGARVVAALAARFRDLDLAEEALADALAAAVPAWRTHGVPRDGGAWLYAAAQRKALDRLRRLRVRTAAVLDEPDPEPTPEDVVIGAFQPLPDERLRLIFICCHPAVAPSARAALTLKVVCGLSTARLAGAFLTTEATIQQRLVRAKAKIRESGAPFEAPGPEAWPERLDAVLQTLEVAYSQAYEDAALAGDAAMFAAEVLRLSSLLVELMPAEPEVLGLAAMVRFAEARRPARVDASGTMIPLAEQDPARWDARQADEGMALLARAARLGRSGPRQLLAAIHGAHLRRINGAPTPWLQIVALYDALLACRPTSVVAVNRAMALAQTAGPDAALEALNAAGTWSELAGWAPWHAARADLLARLGRRCEAASAFDAAFALSHGTAERAHLKRRAAECRAG